MSEVRCRRCNRALTNPKSVSRGVGPVCWKHIHGGAVKSYTKNLVEVFCGKTQTSVSIPQKIIMMEHEVKL